MKNILCALILLATVVGAFAQNDPTTDTLIYAEGKIISGSTKEPITAKISYQSLPYGSKVGFLSGSSFSFPLYDKEKYSIVVEANGFAPAKYMLDPAQANGSRRVIQDIELALPVAVGTGTGTDGPKAPPIGKVMRLGNLIFQVGNANISPQSYPELDEVTKMLHDNPSMVIQLEGHTDVKGDARKNMELSRERVEAVRNYLIAKGGSKARIKTKAFGGTMPLSKENTEEAHKLNRRVELRILEN